MSLILDLLQSRQRSSQDLKLDAWPIACGPTDRDIKQVYTQHTDLGTSASRTCLDNFASGDSHTASSCNGGGTGSQAQARSPSSDLSEPAKRPSAAQRKLHSNRQAQKRFRERQKVCFRDKSVRRFTSAVDKATSLFTGKVAYCGSKAARNHSSA